MNLEQAPANPVHRPSRLRLMCFPLAVLLLGGCEYAVQLEVPLVTDFVDVIFYYTTTSSSSVRGRVLDPDGAAVAGATVTLHFEGSSWNGHYYEYVSFTRSVVSDHFGYFDIYIESRAVIDYENLDHRHFTLTFEAGPGLAPREDTFHGSLAGHPNLGSFVLPWGS